MSRIERRATDEATVITQDQLNQEVGNAFEEMGHAFVVQYFSGTGHLITPLGHVEQMGRGNDVTRKASRPDAIVLKATERGLKVTHVVEITTNDDTKSSLQAQYEGLYAYKRMLKAHAKRLFIQTGTLSAMGFEEGETEMMEVEANPDDIQILFVSPIDRFPVAAIDLSMADVGRVQEMHVPIKARELRRKVRGERTVKNRKTFPGKRRQSIDWSQVNIATA